VIPAGDFLMGSNKDNEASPLHKVSLSSFGMGATPVTVGLWKEYATAKLGGHMPPQDIFSGFTDTRKFNIGWKELDHPIVSVSWEDCRKFCMWASEVSGISLDLPSEAQWEFACRGGVSGQEFPWGSLYDDSKVWSTFVYQRKSTAPVNRSDNIYRNRFGLADMVGNVQVWCLDWYDPQWYGRAQASGSDIVNTSSAPAIYRNNLDQKAFAFRCVRGASWDSSHPSNCFCTARDRKNPVRCSNSVGFRLSARLS
jgi:formylglycine-generating enzyme required for sulfatase activity